MKRRSSERGSVTLEYIIVSTCAAALSLGAFVFMSKILKERMAQMAEKLGVEFSADGWQE